MANDNLQVLDLTTEDEEDLQWGPHVETLLNGLEEHIKLCTLKLEVDEEAFGPNFCHLRQFLSKNRHVTVTNEEGLLYSDDSSIDNLYALNRFYLGSAKLEPLSERSSLVATALMESASDDFQRSALLLSNHTDVSCDFVQFARIDEVGEEASLSQMDQDNVLKRRRSRD